MSTIEKLLQTCITEPDALARNWNLTEEEIRQLRAITDVYPIRIPKYYLDLIGPDWKSDPIRKLCFPDLMEISTSGQKDTSGEARNTKMTGLQHKYAQTALILTTNQCAMYCRHCFRKRMVGSDAREVALHMDGMKAYVEQHKEIDNVLLSGGDALMLENAVMRQYLEAFSSIKHLHFIRIGTRIPVVLPDRILQDPELIDLLKTYNRKKQLIIVTHYNHSKEITEKSRQAVKILLEAGIPVRNQTVLLQGINDDPKTLFFAEPVNFHWRYALLYFSMSSGDGCHETVSGSVAEGLAYRRTSTCADERSGKGLSLCVIPRKRKN